jgi:hypothetical protein
VPYSASVNLGSKAALARGAIRQRVIMSDKTRPGAQWYIGTILSITDFTNANPAKVTTSTNHQYASNNSVGIWGVSGMTPLWWSGAAEINGNIFTVGTITLKTFQLKGVNTSSKYDIYRGGGSTAKCVKAGCPMVINSPAHGFVNGDEVYISGVSSPSALNDSWYTITNTTANTLDLQSYNPVGLPAYTSGGTLDCRKYGCKELRFTDIYGGSRTQAATTCVTERTGAEAYTDAAPASAPVGFHYGSSSSTCPAATVTPLSSDKTALKAQIDSFVADGSTAGHIGIAWGWYTLSPNFNSLWAASSAAGAYDAQVTKVAVLMTDGDFNTAYCKGVTASDYAYSWNETINCNATNGNPFDQAKALCAAMKAKGIKIYTVGFGTDLGATAKNVLETCASDSSKFFMASNGQALQDAFAAIAVDISKLRLTK